MLSLPGSGFGRARQAMDLPNMPPHSDPPDNDAASAPLSNADAANVIEQVRELLFGDHRRATEGALKGLEDRLVALTATVEARLADLERRIEESRAAADRAQDGHVQAIGAALNELGDRIKGLVAKPHEG
jgi:hypothetical protein